MTYRKTITSFCALSLTAVLLTACASTSTVPESALTGLSSGDYQTAATTLEQTVKDSPRSESAWRCLGIAYMGLGQYEEAATAFETALSHAGAIPGSMEYDINDYLGSCYFKLGKYEKALKVYDAICTLHPRDASALVMRGAVKVAMDDTDGMDRDFQQAIALEPQNYDLLIEIYQTTEANGCEKIGQGYIQNALDQNRDSMSSYDRGRLAYYAGDYQSARTALEQIKDQNNDEVSILLGQTYEALGDYNYAASVYQSYLDHDSSHAEVYNQLGLCYLKMDDPSSALSAFESGLALQDSDAAQSLAFNQIVAYERLGDFQRAAVLMQTYLQNYPGDETAKRENVFLSSRASSMQNDAASAQDGSTEASKDRRQS